MLCHATWRRRFSWTYPVHADPTWKLGSDRQIVVGLVGSSTIWLSLDARGEPRYVHHSGRWTDVAGFAESEHAGRFLAAVAQREVNPEKEPWEFDKQWGLARMRLPLASEEPGLAGESPRRR